METLEIQLKKDFYAHIDSAQAYNQSQSFPTLNLLTQEELQELETVWIELCLWQRQQSY
ncbi:hypothetical protein M9194_06960 [Vibrio sp. S4M6]|uniref:hypothetical protein n=1 Tax=Vibrio sinus TaxID=2946865 RepID=UPI00202AA7AA|nr:hypothetical protein [Vibrio sinus]